MTDRVVAIKPAMPAADGLARPKVMRRPAHFSDAAPSTSVQPFSAPDLIPREKPTLTSKAWQDDGRFAVALLAIVILTNLAVMAWLNHIGPQQKHGASPILVSAPAPETATPSATVFTQPEHSTNDTMLMDEDSPAPTVHLLDDGVATVEQ